MLRTVERLHYRLAVLRFRHLGERFLVEKRFLHIAFHKEIKVLGDVGIVALVADKQIELARFGLCKTEKGFNAVVRLFGNAVGKLLLFKSCLELVYTVDTFGADLLFTDNLAIRL